MKRSMHRNGKRQEAGIALLLAIFVLLVISVVAVAMIVDTGTESALAGNYRASTGAYYAAVAGLEEGRGRLLPKNPNYFDNTVSTFMPTFGTTLAVGQVRYILNPASGETVAPTNYSSTTSYPDTEYAAEFGANPSSGNVQTITSTNALVTGVTAPLYKWVRITPATEQSIGKDVNNDGTIDNTTPLFYDSAHLPLPSLIVTLAPPSTAQQVFQVTSFAVLPNGSEKMVQYTVAPLTFNLNLPSALSIGSNNITFSGASSNPYQVDGQDGSGSPPPVAGCTTNPNTYMEAIGATNASDVTSIVSGIPSNRVDHYTGAGGATPNVGLVSMPNSLDTPQDAYNTVQKIAAAADLVINGDATPSNLPSAMSVNNPMTVVVDGNFSMSGNFTGYGLLVVTGNFSYTGNTGWKGIVLVVGDGTTTYAGSGGGNNEFDGAIYVSTIWDSSHNILSAFGPVNYDISGGGGNGIYYNSCWIKAAQQPATYHILSFKEIPFNE
jgi:Tfp pilus assembly protein PilX